MGQRVKPMLTTCLATASSLLICLCMISFSLPSVKQDKIEIKFLTLCQTMNFINTGLTFLLYNITTKFSFSNSVFKSCNL